MVQYIPLLITAMTVCFGFITYRFQKTRDRKEELIKLRRSEYRKWIQLLYDLAVGEESEKNEFNKATNDLFLFASDRVIRSAGAFKKYMASTSPGAPDGATRDTKELSLMLARVTREMRNDCFESTSLTEEEIRRLLPIEGAGD